MAERSYQWGRVPASGLFTKPLLEGMGIAPGSCQISSRGPADLQQRLTEVVRSDPAGFIEGKDLLPIHPVIDLGDVVESSAQPRRCFQRSAKASRKLTSLAAGSVHNSTLVSGQQEGHRPHDPHTPLGSIGAELPPLLVEQVLEIFIEPDVPIQPDAQPIQLCVETMGHPLAPERKRQTLELLIDGGKEGVVASSQSRFSSRKRSNLLSGWEPRASNTISSALYLAAATLG